MICESFPSTIIITGVAITPVTIALHPIIQIRGIPTQQEVGIKLNSAEKKTQTFFKDFNYDQFLEEGIYYTKGEDPTRAYNILLLYWEMTDVIA